MAVAGPSRLPDVATGFTIASALLKKRKDPETRQQREAKDAEQRCSKSASQHDGETNVYSLVHLDHPSYAVHCLCFHVPLMRVLPCAGSIRTFVHVRRQTIFVHVVGIVVGIEERDKKVVWLVDDGSAVLAVHYHHNTRPITKPKTVKSGIPSKYLRPSTPPPPPHTTMTSDDFTNSIAHFDICNTVSVVGRLEVRFNERILQVDRVLPASCELEDDLTFRSEREGYIMLLKDINQEAKHALRAISLAQTEYTTEASYETVTGHPRMLLQPLNGWRGSEEKTSEASLTEVLPPAKRPRRLRDYRKLSDNHLTEQLLRVYVQKHIYDHCSGVHIAGGHEQQQQPPAFGVAYLMCVRNLFGLAKRIVTYEQSKQRRRRLRSSGTAAVQPSQEDPNKKIARLFQSVIRSVMLDGMLVLADRDVLLTAPYDGRRPTDTTSFDPDGSLFRWDGATAAAQQEDTQVIRSDTQNEAGCDLSMIKWRGMEGKDERRQDAYQMVTPALLTEPISNYIKSKLPAKRAPLKPLGVSLARRTQHAQDTISKSAAHDNLVNLLREADPQQILEHLRRTDDRWKYLQRDPVADCVAQMMQKSTANGM